MPARIKLSRRVLAALGVATGAAAAALVAAARPVQAMKPPGGKGGAHYQETAHVNQYYKVNRY